MSRRERQHAEILRALRRGEDARVLVLSREHLSEFPDDDDVRAAAEEVVRREGERRWPG